MSDQQPLASAAQIPALFRLMADRVPGVVWATDRDLRFTASFGAGLPVLGLHPSEVVGKTLFEYFQTEDADFPPIAAHCRALRGEAAELEECWQGRTYQVRVEPLVDESQAVIGCVGFAQDITDLKREEAALRASAAKYRRLYQSMMDAFVSVDMHGRIQEFNDVYRRLLGYEPEELSALSYIDITPEKWHTFEARIVREQVLARGYSEIYEKEYRRKDGTVFPVELRTFLITDDQGRPAAMWAIVRDITARQRAAKELQAAHDRLERRVLERTAELTQANQALQREVDQRRQAEEKLIVFRRFVEAATQGFGMADLDGRMIYANPFLTQMFGAQRPEDVIGQYVSALYPPDYVIRRNQEILPALRAKGHWQGEQTLVLPDGRVRPTIHSVFAVHDANGELLCTAGVITDITELKRAEAALRQSYEELRRSEERYDLAVRGSGAGIWDWDLRTGRVFYSPRWKMLFGYAEDEIGDGFEDWSSRLHPDERELILGLQEQFLAGTSLTATAEYRFRHKDGSYRWIIAHVLAVRDADGKAVRLVGSHGDITDRKQAEEAVRQSEAKYRALVESCPDAVAMADLRGRVTFASQKAAEQHGFLHPEELLDKTAAELVVEADRDRFRANTLRLIEEGLRRDDEYRGLRQDGTTFDAEVTAAVIRDATGRPESLMAVYRDVSQRKRAEAQLRQSHEELQAICDGMVDGLLVADVDTRQFVQTNPVMCQMLGYSQEELLRLAVPDLHPPEDLPRLQAAFQAAAEGGLSAVRECRLVRKDRRIVYADINATAVVRGPRRYLVGFFHDVTERWRADEELKWSLRNQTALSSLLRGTLEAITLTKQLERALHVLLSIPWLALEPKGAIFTVDESTNTLVMRCQQGLSQEVVTNCSQLPVGTCLCGQAAASREIVFADKIDERHELHDPGMAPHGHYCVPILSGDRVLGVLNLYLREGHQANPNERIFLSSVADVLAELLVRHQAEASLREQEAELLGAKRIQQRLLPRSDPNLPGFDIAGASYPARLAGGDLFDFLAFPDGSLAIIIGDVCGHGMRSALVMAQTHAYLHAMGEAQSDLGAILTAANAILAGHLDEAMFVTLFCAKLEPRDRTLHYFSAGHPAVCVLDASGAVTRRLDSTAMPLGVEPHTVFAASGPIVLEPGDIALLLTDGILEAQARGGLVFGVERALDIVRVNRDKSAREIVESLCTAAREFSQPVEPEDDITAVVVKVGSPSG